MMYAMISEKDGQTSLAYFKGKKIPQSHYVPVSRLQHLVKVLNDGDVVLVINADRFPSAGVWSLFLGTAGGCAPATAHAALCWLFMTSVRTTATVGQKAITGQNTALMQRSLLYGIRN